MTQNANISIFYFFLHFCTKTYACIFCVFVFCVITFLQSHYLTKCRSIRGNFWQKCFCGYQLCLSRDGFSWEKKWQNSVHVVVEWPLSCFSLRLNSGFWCTMTYQCFILRLACLRIARVHSTKLWLFLTKNLTIFWENKTPSLETLF